jgi:phenylalanyl-tRNA synthetase beta chain
LDIFEKTQFSDDIFDYGLSYGIKTGKNETSEIAKVGHVRKKIAKQVEVGQDVFYAELDWDLILQRVQPKIRFKELSKFPAVRRDLALILDKQVSYAQIEAIALKTAGKLLKEINVFSVFEGEQIGADKKSVAIYFLLQDLEKTLDEKTLDYMQERMISAFEKELGAVIRR